jgi:hypothetical protein
VVFTRPGWGRFVPWVTGMVLGWDEHTLTQLLTALGLESRWRVLEHVAEYGAWDREAVERQTLQVLAHEQPARWGPYHPVAMDATNGHRTSKQVGGTCPFHEARAHRPNRAETVRAQNWVVMGDLLPGWPWTSRPHAARLYGRQSQLPVGETFRTKPALAVGLLQQADCEAAAPILAVFAGADAVETVVEPGVTPRPGQRRIGLVTRLRADARLYHPVGPRPRAKGRPPTWGPRIAAPQHHVYGPASWQRGRAWVDGRLRSFQDTQLRCRWAVSGPPCPVHVLVVQMAGYAAPCFLVTSALELSAAQVVEVWAARFRQEDGFRAHKQRLGLAECRAWTKEPILRTVPVHLVALTLLRLLPGRLDQAWGAGSWWSKPEWKGRKRPASILDLRRLFWRDCPEFSPFLVALEDLEKIPQPLPLRQDLTGRAA